MKTKFAKRFLVALAIVASVAALCVMGACGKKDDDDDVVGVYEITVTGAFSEETYRFDLRDEGQARFYFINSLFTDEYRGTYTNEGTTVYVSALTNVDTTSEYMYPGLVDGIDPDTGDCTIIVDKDNGTFEFVTTSSSDSSNTDGTTSDGTEGEETSDLVPPEMPAEDAEPTASYTTSMTTAIGTSETAQLDLYEGGICTLRDNDGTIGPVALTYYGTYVEITGEPATSIYVSDLKDEEGNPIPGDEASQMNFPFVTNCGFKATLTEASTGGDEAAGAFTVIARVGTYIYADETTMGSEDNELILYEDGTCTLHNLTSPMTQLNGVYYGTYTTDGDGEEGENKITVSSLTLADGTTKIPGVDNPTQLGENISLCFGYVINSGFTATLDDDAGTFTPDEVSSEGGE